MKLTGSRIITIFLFLGLVSNSSLAKDGLSFELSCKAVLLRNKVAQNEEILKKSVKYEWDQANNTYKLTDSKSNQNSNESLKLFESKSKKPRLSLIDATRPEANSKTMPFIVKSTIPAANFVTTFNFNGQYLQNKVDNFTQLFDNHFQFLKEDLIKLLAHQLELANKKLSSSEPGSSAAINAQRKLKLFKKLLVDLKSSDKARAVKTIQITTEDFNKYQMDSKLRTSIEHNLKQFHYAEKSLLEAQRNMKREQIKYSANVSVRVLINNSTWHNQAHTLEMATEFYRKTAKGKKLLGYGLRSTDQLQYNSFIANNMENVQIVTFDSLLNPEFYDKFYDHQKSKEFRKDIKNTLRIKNLASGGPDYQTYNPNRLYDSKVIFSNSTLYLQGINAEKNSLVEGRVARELVTLCLVKIKRIDPLKFPREGLLCSSGSTKYTN